MWRRNDVKSQCLNDRVTWPPIQPMYWQHVLLFVFYPSHGSDKGMWDKICRLMQNSDPGGQNFLSAPNTHVWFFSCIPFDFECLILKVAIITYVRFLYSCIPDKGNSCLVCKNIRILHRYEIRIENSVPRVTVCHHEALPSDAKQWSRGTEFSVRTEHSCLILFLHTFRFRMSYFKSSNHYLIQWRWRMKCF